MRIDKIEISRFGGLSGLVLTPGGGVNIVEGSNERGKSSVAAFIKYIFYGFSDKRERTAALPVSGGGVGGVAEITVNGRSLRIERETAADGTERLTVTALGSLSPLKLSRSPGETLFGIDAEVFMRTAFITQTGGGAIADGGASGDAVGAAIENLLYSADESISTEKALDTLDAARVKLRHKNGRGGSIGALMSQREQLSARLSAAETSSADIISREATLRELTKKIEDNREMSMNIADKLHSLDIAELGDKIARLRSSEHEYGRSVREYRACAAQFKAEGYDSPAKYLARLREQSASLDAIGRQLDETRGVLSGDAATAPAEENNEVSPTSDAELLELEVKLNEDGGQDAVAAKCAKCERSVKLMTALCGVSLFFTILFAGGAALAYLNMPEFTVPAVAAAGVCAIALVVLALLRSRRTDERAALLERYCCSEADELSGTLDYIMRSAGRLRERIHRQKELESQRGARESERSAIVGHISDAYKAKSDEIAAMLASSGRSGDVSEAIAELSDYCVRLRSLYDEALRRRDEVTKQRSSLCDIDIAAAEEKARTLDRAALAGLDRRELKRRYDFSTAAVATMTGHVHETEVELASRRACCESAAELAEAISDIDRQLYDEISRADALLLAHDKLREASDGLRSDVTPKLSANAGKLMSEATGGRYDEIGVSPELGLYFRADGRTLPDSYMSGGTRDAAYVALRFALLELLCRTTTPPVLLDEAFSRLDDTRMENMLRILAAKAKNGVQTFVFTSSGREGEIMQRVGEFNHIEM
ncbi:MAG: AAA family ATPase [Eubacteriales bacterium]